MIDQENEFSINRANPGEHESEVPGLQDNRQHQHHHTT